MTWDELTTEMNGKMQFPGWTNAWTMPIKTRVDMLTTGVRTPIGIKVFGTDLNEVEKVGVALEHVLAPIRGTRSVLYERNLGGLYLDIIPKPDELARYGLRVADVERVIESAIGGTPIGTTIEGRNRFSINVRYPQDLRSDLESLRQVLVPIGARQRRRLDGRRRHARWGRRAPWRRRRRRRRSPRGRARLAAPDLPRARTWRAWAAAPSPGGGAGMARPRLPSGADASASDMPSDGLDGRRADAGAAVGGMPSPSGGRAGAAPPAAAARGRQSFVPLGQVADIKVAGGPPMVRDEAGLLVGYVYVDIDQAPARHRRLRQRGQGGRRAARWRAASSSCRPATYLKWTGQYEQLAEMLGAHEDRRAADAADHRRCCCSCSSGTSSRC